MMMMMMAVVSSLCICALFQTKKPQPGKLGVFSQTHYYLALYRFKAVEKDDLDLQWVNSDSRCLESHSHISLLYPLPQLLHLSSPPLSLTLVLPVGHIVAFVCSCLYPQASFHLCLPLCTVCSDWICEMKNILNSVKKKQKNKSTSERGKNMVGNPKESIN